VLVLTVFLADSGELRAYASQAAAPAPSFSIPEELGRIESFFSADPAKTILYIQDAHDSLEAQKNIAGLISHLVEREGVETVFEEGYEGPVPTDRFFPAASGPAAKRRLSDFLLHKLRIGGAEYAHINRTRGFRLIGADDLVKYKKNIEAFRAAAKQNEAVARDLEAILAEIEALANRHFPKPVKEWLKLRDRLDDGAIELLDYLKRSVRLLPEGTAAAGKIPSLILLLKAGEPGGAQFLEQAGEVEAQTVFQEMAVLEALISARFLTSPRDLAVLRYREAFHLLSRLNQIKVTPAEYAASKDNLSKLDTRELADFIARESGKSLVLSSAWEDNIRTASGFYEMAHERDRAIESALAGFVNGSAEKTAVLVYGGFHKAGIEAILRRLKVSYHILTPKISGPDPVHEDYYKQLMAVGHHEYEKSFLPAGDGGEILGEQAARPEDSARPPSAFVEPYGEAAVRTLYETAALYPDIPAELLDRQFLETRSELRAGGTYPVKSEALLDEIVKVLPEGRHNDFSMLVLGSRQGTFELDIARARRNARILGLESDAKLFAESRKNLERAIAQKRVREGQAEFRQGHFSEPPYREAMEKTDYVLYYEGDLKRAETLDRVLVRSVKPGAAVIVIGSGTEPSEFVWSLLASENFELEIDAQPFYVLRRLPAQAVSQAADAETETVPEGVRDGESSTPLAPAPENVLPGEITPAPAPSEAVNGRVSEPVKPLIQQPAPEDRTLIGRGKEVEISTGGKILVSGFDFNPTHVIQLEVSAVKRRSGDNFSGRRASTKKEAVIRVSIPPGIMVFREAEWLDFLEEVENRGGAVARSGHWNNAKLDAIRRRRQQKNPHNDFINWDFFWMEEKRLFFFDLSTKARIEIQMTNADLNQGAVTMSLAPFGITSEKAGNFFYKTVPAPEKDTPAEKGNGKAVRGEAAQETRSELRPYPDATASGQIDSHELDVRSNRGTKGFLGNEDMGPRPELREAAARQERLEVFLENRRIKDRQNSDGTLYVPTPPQLLPVILNEIKKKAGDLKGKNYFSFGAGTLGDSLGAAVLEEMKVTAVEKDRILSEKSEAVLADALREGLIPEGALTFFPRTDAFDVSWAEADVVYFFYTQAWVPEKYSEIARNKFEEKLAGKIAGMKPGAVLAFLFTGSQLLAGQGDYETLKRLEPEVIQISDRMNGLYLHLYTVPPKPELKNPAGAEGEALRSELREPYDYAVPAAVSLRGSRNQERDLNNSDIYLIHRVELEGVTQGKGTLLLVADGFGYHMETQEEDMGDFTVSAEKKVHDISGYIRETFASFFEQIFKDIQERTPGEAVDLHEVFQLTVSELRNAMRQAYNEGLADPKSPFYGKNYRSEGATMTAVYVPDDGTAAEGFFLGDSPLVAFGPKSADPLFETFAIEHNVMTNDGELQRVESEGILVKYEVFDDGSREPKGVVLRPKGARAAVTDADGRIQLTRAFFIGSYMEDSVSTEPDYFTIPFPEDGSPLYLALGSDGAFAHGHEDAGRRMREIMRDMRKGIPIDEVLGPQRTDDTTLLGWKIVSPGKIPAASIEPRSELRNSDILEYVSPEEVDALSPGGLALLSGPLKNAVAQQPRIQNKTVFILTALAGAAAPLFSSLSLLRYLSARERKIMRIENLVRSAASKVPGEKLRALNSMLKLLLDSIDPAEDADVRAVSHEILKVLALRIGGLGWLINQALRDLPIPRTGISASESAYKPWLFGGRAEDSLAAMPAGYYGTLYEMGAAQDSSRSELRPGEAPPSPEEHRAQIVRRISEPLGKDQLKTLSFSPADKEFQAFRRAIKEAPGMADYFAELHFDLMDLNLHEGEKIQAEFPLGQDLTLRITSLVREPRGDHRTNILRVLNKVTGTEKIVGYVNHSIRDEKDGPVATVGIDIFIPFRGRRDAELPFDSAAIFENSLRLIRHFNPRLSRFEVMSGQFADIFSAALDPDGNPFRIGSELQNTVFYLKQGFYPQGHLEDADAALMKQFGGEKIPDTELQALARSAPYWELPLGRSELRSESGKLNRDSFIASSQGKAHEDRALLLSDETQLQPAAIQWEEMKRVIEAGMQKLRDKAASPADDWDLRQLPGILEYAESAVRRLYRLAETGRVFETAPLVYAKADYSFGLGTDQGLLVVPDFLSLAPALAAEYLFRVAALPEKELYKSNLALERMFPENTEKRASLLKRVIDEKRLRLAEIRDNRDLGLEIRGLLQDRGNLDFYLLEPADVERSGTFTMNLSDALKKANPVLYGDYETMKIAAAPFRGQKIKASAALGRRAGLAASWNVPEKVQAALIEVLEENNKDTLLVEISVLMPLLYLVEEDYPDAKKLLSDFIAGKKELELLPFERFNRIIEEQRRREEDQPENLEYEEASQLETKRRREQELLSRLFISLAPQNLGILFRQYLLANQQETKSALSFFNKLYDLGSTDKTFNWAGHFWGFYLDPRNTPGETGFFKAQLLQAAEKYYELKERLPGLVLTTLKENNEISAPRALSIFYTLEWDDQMRQVIFPVLALIPDDAARGAAFAYLNSLFFGTDSERGRHSHEEDLVQEALGAGAVSSYPYLLALRDLRRKGGAMGSQAHDQLIWASRALDDNQGFPGADRRTWFSGFRESIHNSFRKEQLVTVERLLKFLNTGDASVLTEEGKSREASFQESVSADAMANYRKITQNAVRKFHEQGFASDPLGAAFLWDILKYSEEEVIAALTEANPGADSADVSKVEMLFRLYYAFQAKFGTVAAQVQEDLRQGIENIAGWKLGDREKTFREHYENLLAALTRGDSEEVFRRVTAMRETLREIFLSKDLEIDDYRETRLQELLDLEYALRTTGDEILPEIAHQAAAALQEGNLSAAAGKTALIARFIYAGGYGGEDFRDFIRELEEGSLKRSQLSDLVRAMLTEVHKAMRRRNDEMRVALASINPGIKPGNLTAEIRAKTRITKVNQTTGEGEDIYSYEEAIVTGEAREELGGWAVDEFLRESRLPVLEGVLTAFQDTLQLSPAAEDLAVSERKIDAAEASGLDRHFFRFGPDESSERPELLSLWSRKGLNLVRMARRGMSIPPGVITSAELTFQPEIRRSPEFRDKVLEEVERLRNYSTYPDLKLLLYARSGSAFMMPGLMVTIPNLGMNDSEAAELARSTGDTWFAYDTYGELLRSFGINIYGIPEEEFQQVFDVSKKDEATGEEMKRATEGYLALYAKHSRLFPETLIAQVMEAMENVFGSWDSETARHYRERHQLSDQWGTVVILQKGMFGNLAAGEGKDISGVGAAALRTLPGGSEAVHGKFRIRAIGEQLMSRAENYSLLSASQKVDPAEGSFEEKYPEHYDELMQHGRRLRELFGYRQLFEFVIERGKIWITQSNDDYVRDDYPELAETAEEPLARGHGVSGGALRGWAAGSVEAADLLLKKLKEEKTEGVDGVILFVDRVNPEFLNQLPQDVHIIAKKISIHAETLAQARGITALYGVTGMEFDAAAGSWKLGGQPVPDGTLITIDGHENPLVYHQSGKIFSGALPLKTTARSEMRPTPNGEPRAENPAEPGLLTVDVIRGVIAKENIAGLEVGALNNNFTVSPVSSNPDRDILTSLGRVSGALKAYADRYQFLVIDHRMTGERDDVRLDINLRAAAAKAPRRPRKSSGRSELRTVENSLDGAEWLPVNAETIKKFTADVKAAAAEDTSGEGIFVFDFDHDTNRMIYAVSPREKDGKEFFHKRLIGNHDRQGFVVSGIYETFKSGSVFLTLAPRLTGSEKQVNLKGRFNEAAVPLVRMLTAGGFPEETHVLGALFFDKETDAQLVTLGSILLAAEENRLEKVEWHQKVVFRPVRVTRDRLEIYFPVLAAGGLSKLPELVIRPLDIQQDQAQIAAWASNAGRAGAPYYPGIYQEGAGLFTVENGVERLQGYLSFEEIYAGFDPRQQSYTYGLGISKAEIRPQTEILRGQEKGIALILLDYMVKYAHESGIVTSGISFNPRVQPNPEDLARAAAEAGFVDQKPGTSELKGSALTRRYETTGLGTRLNRYYRPGEALPAQDARSEIRTDASASARESIPKPDVVESRTVRPESFLGLAQRNLTGEEKGTFLINSDVLAQLEASQKDELFSRLYLNKSGLRLVVFNERGQIPPADTALRAILKLANVFSTSETSYAAAGEKYGFPGTSRILLMLPGEELKEAGTLVKGVRLKKAAGEIEFARLLAMNGGSLPNVPEENGVFDPPGGFLAELDRKILSDLVIAYAA